ncbi:hypothetical protein HYU20_04145 [Candidatus Woesearchaeota archaeon]|nr:hypothetical protein [Candidatus Woesearchaeota archaeon]
MRIKIWDFFIYGALFFLLGATYIFLALPDDLLYATIFTFLFGFASTLSALYLIFINHLRQNSKLELSRGLWIALIVGFILAAVLARITFLKTSLIFVFLSFLAVATSLIDFLGLKRKKTMMNFLGLVSLASLNYAMVFLYGKGLLFMILFFMIALECC